MGRVAGRAFWVWPAAFVGVMLAAGGLGLAGVPAPFVESGILASIVVLGLLTALAVRLPVAVGAVIVGVFAFFHGHAHGAEAPAHATALLYGLGFGLATAALHGVGLLAGSVSKAAAWRYLIRGAGVVTACAGLLLIVAEL